MVPVAERTSESKRMVFEALLEEWLKTEREAWPYFTTKIATEADGWRQRYELAED
jgi:hypothetical protein